MALPKGRQYTQNCPCLKEMSSSCADAAARDATTMHLLLPAVVLAFCSTLQLRQCETFSLLAAQMRLHGGRGTDAVDATTTHLLLSSPSATPLEPAAVLGAVRAQAGGAAGLRAMRAGLQRGSLQLVTDRCAAICAMICGRKISSREGQLDDLTGFQRAGARQLAASH